MSTPLEVRNKRREAQRTIRLALNAINNSLDSWKAAVDAGKKHATDLTNCILRSSHIPQLPLAALNDISGLKQAALNKISSEMTLHLSRLLESLQDLEIAVESLSQAVSPLAMMSQQEESEKILRNGPVFTALPLHTVNAMFQRIERMYQAELNLKTVVVNDFQTACLEAQGRAQKKDYSESLSSKKSEDIEAFLQVHITAWMLSPEIDDAAVEADIEMVTQDANSC